MFDQTFMQRYNFVPMNHEKPNFFPVSTGLIYDNEGRAIPNRCRVYREDTGDTLGVHTSSYSMVPYEHNSLVIEDAIRASTIPLGDWQVQTDQAENGAKIFRQYVFPETRQRIETAGGERNLTLRICTWDSYDGSTSFKARAGALDWVCANESVHGKVLSNVQLRHTGDMEERVKKAADDMVLALGNYMKEIERVSRWSKIGLSHGMVTELLKALPQTSKSLQDEMTAKFARMYSMGEGTLFDFWSMLTDWSTHNIPAKTKSDRQKRVADLVEGRDWVRLET